MPNSASSADISGVSTLVKMSLNWMTSKRLISIQEAVHEVDRQSLTLCSEVINYVSLQSCLKLRKSSDPRPRISFTTTLTGLRYTLIFLWSSSFTRYGAKRTSSEIRTATGQ